MSAPNLKPMSVEEYLRTEEASPIKREYVGGFVYPLHGATRGQAGASRAHIVIVSNIVRALGDAADARGCYLYTSEMKLFIEGASAFYYPDVMLVCDPADENPETMYETAPCLLIEVASKSTARNDRLAKYMAYTALPTLQTYLIVEQTERRIYAYEREGQSWKLRELIGGGSAPVPCLNRSLSLDEVYRNVALA